MRRAAAGALLAALLAAGCINVTDSDRDVVLGSGVIVSEARDLEAFDRIEFASEGRVLVSPGTERSLLITADDNLHQYLETSVRGTTLWIRTADDIDIDPSDSIVFRIGVDDLQSVEVTGVADVEIPELRRGSFTIEFSGVGEVRVENLNVDRLQVTASGVGKITVAGEAATADVSLTGTADYEARELRTAETAVSASGPGDAVVWATQQLTADLSSTGRVRYRGDPVVESSVTGTGTLERLEE